MFVFAIERNEVGGDGGDDKNETLSSKTYMSPKPTVEIVAERK